MELARCNLCGKLFVPFSHPGHNKGFCRECEIKLEALYLSSGISEYIKSHKINGEIDANKISQELNIPRRDLELMIEAGLLERDIQTYSKTPSRRQVLAEAFEHEINRLVKPHHIESVKRKITTYGGKIYNRRKYLRGGGD